MTLRLPLALALAAMLAACASTTPQPARPTPPATPKPDKGAGLERVIGRDAKALKAQFGEPDQDLREGAARRLQFAGPACVLDAYLYPPAAGREPVVTHVDARQPNGDDFDKASCIAALVRR